MNKLLQLVAVSLLLFSVTPTSLLAQCPAGDVAFHAQADVDAFVATYPTCTAISGDLYIGTLPGSELLSDISDLSGLMLQTISGSVNIATNPSLSALAGLDNLTSINGRLDITNNDGLTNIDVFNNLFVGLHITISENDALTEISGLNGISTMRRISVFNNSSLTTISGFSAMDVFLDFNIENNPVLTEVSGFSYLSLGTLSLLNNASLAICNVAGICQAVMDGAVSKNISGNASGCDSEGAIQAACLFGLPVELVSFEIEQRNLGHILTWTTSSERNNLGFGIEHSIDGSHWQSLGFVEGQMNSNIRIDYRFEHEQAGTGLHYYRLKQMDFDGQMEYSDIVQNFIGLGQKEGQLSAYPNPSNGLVNLVVNNPNGKKGKLVLASVQGQQLLDVDFVEGDFQDSWVQQIEDLAPGFYVLRLQLGQSVTWEKFQVIDNN